MLLNLTDISDEPLQGQISRQIRAKIMQAELESDAGLPSIRELAREGKVSVITVQRAYEILEREGLIHARRGKGFFVSEMSDKAKKELTMGRLVKSLGPIIRTALEEGLSAREIKKTIDDISEKGNDEA